MALNKQNRHYWTAHEDRQVLELAERGCSAADIAAVIGRGPYAVERRAKNLGIEVSRAPRVDAGLDAVFSAPSPPRRFSWEGQP